MRPLLGKPRMFLRPTAFTIVILATLTIPAWAWTIDTGCVIGTDATQSASCTLTNLHTTKTAAIAATSGLYLCSNSGANPDFILFGMSGASLPPASTTASTVSGSDGILGSALPDGVRCHFDVTGIPKAKARGLLVTSSGTIEAH